MGNQISQKSEALIDLEPSEKARAGLLAGMIF
jgi:hypothetical protein